MANGVWMSQIGRNVTDAMEGLPRGKRYLIHDRDPLFTREFLGGIGVESVPGNAVGGAYGKRYREPLALAVVDAHLPAAKLCARQLADRERCAAETISARRRFSGGSFRDRAIRRKPVVGESVATGYRGFEK